MTWTKFEDKFPDIPTILYYNTEFDHRCVAYVRDNGTIISSGFFCNNPKCKWTFDDCCCDLDIKLNDFWMPLPEEPKEYEKSKIDVKDGIQFQCYDCHVHLQYGITSTTCDDKNWRCSDCYMKFMRFGK